MNSKSILRLLLVPCLLSVIPGLAPAQTSGQIALQKKNVGAGYTIKSVTPLANAVWVFDGSSNPAVATSLSQSIITNLTTDLAGKQPLNGNLTDLAGLAFTNAYGRSLLTMSDAGALRDDLDLVVGTDILAYDADLNAISVLTTASYGRSVLTLADSAAAQSYFALVIGTNVLAYDTQVQQIAALTDPNADRLLFWDDSDNEFKHLTLGTNLSITGTTLNAAGGGSVAHPGTAIAYVYPQVGNDTTGDGTQAAPYDTIQEAFSDGFRVFYLGEGNAGNLGASGDGVNVYILGAGREKSIVGTIRFSGTSGTCTDIGMHSFTCSGSSNVNSSPPDGSGQAGPNATNVQFYNVYINGDFTANGMKGANANGCTAAGNGGLGGSIQFFNCWLGPGCTVVQSRSGDGGDGTDVFSSGNAGSNAGAIHIYNTRGDSLSALESASGSPGADNGGGVGSAGSADGVYINLSQFFTAVSPTGSVVTILGSIMNGTFVATGP